MNEPEVAQDLRFVREVVQRAEDSRPPTALYLLWAAIVLVGFPLPDFSPSHVFLYWAIVGPVGFVASAVLARRHGMQLGVDDRRYGRRSLLHWGVMFLVLALAILLPWSGTLTWEGLAPLAMLLCTSAYLMASIHLDRRLVWPGLMMGAGYAVVLGSFEYRWTLVGVLVALGMVLSAWVGSRPRVAASP